MFQTNFMCLLHTSEEADKQALPVGATMGRKGRAPGHKTRPALFHGRSGSFAHA